jgi:hypothetical protein
VKLAFGRGGGSEGCQRQAHQGIFQFCHHALLSLASHSFKPPGKGPRA